MNNYLNVKYAQNLYNTSLTDMVNKLETRERKLRVKFYSDGSHMEKTKHTCIQCFYEYAWHQWQLTCMC